MIKIRKVVAKDFKEFFRLQNEFMSFNNRNEGVPELKYKLVRNEHKKAFLNKLKQKNSLFIFIEDSEKPFGFLFGEIEEISKAGYVYHIKQQGYLQNIFVSENYRGKGYSHLLVNEFFRFLKEKKIKICNLHVESYNKRAISFYENFGFKVKEYKMVTKL